MELQQRSEIDAGKHIAVEKKKRLFIEKRPRPDNTAAGPQDDLFTRKLQADPALRGAERLFDHGGMMVHVHYRLTHTISRKQGEAVMNQGTVRNRHERFGHTIGKRS
jgi:hypothetical protein